MKINNGTIHKGRPHGGGLRNLQILRTNSTDRMLEMRIRGREGVQNPENYADILYEWSLRLQRLFGTASIQLAKR